MAAAVSGILVGLGVGAVNDYVTRDVKAALVGGAVAAAVTFSFVFIAAGGCPSCSAPARGRRRRAGALRCRSGSGAGAGVGVAAEQITAATAAEEDGAISNLIDFAINMLVSGRGQQLTAVFTAMLGTPQGRAALRTMLHRVTCASIPLVAAKLPRDAMQALVSLCSITLPFASAAGSNVLRRATPRTISAVLSKTEWPTRPSRRCRQNRPSQFSYQTEPPFGLCHRARCQIEVTGTGCSNRQVIRIGRSRS